jgi:ADP-heptose:LPS heptosyltransferase
MAERFETARYFRNGVVSMVPVRIYTGILGQIGDIIIFTATARRLKQLFPNSDITFAVSSKYRAAGELVAGLPYVNRVFVTQYYFEKMRDSINAAWELNWPTDLRGDDEVAEQRRHDIILETRPRHRRAPWWDFDHLVAEMAHMVGVPGPIDLRTEIAIPNDTTVPLGADRKLVLHNDPAIDLRKAWSWANVKSLVQRLGAHMFVLLGNPGPEIPGVLDLRGRTTLAEAAATIRASRCYVGIDSGLMWIAGSLQVSVVGLYGTDYIPNCKAIQPDNPRAVYLQADGAVDGISVDAVAGALKRA